MSAIMRLVLGVDTTLVKIHLDVVMVDVRVVRVPE